MHEPYLENLREKLKLIRERSGLQPDQFAALVAAENGEEILSYESPDTDVPLTVLQAYAKYAGVPVGNLIDDRCDLWFGFRQN